MTPVPTADPVEAVPAAAPPPWPRMAVALLSLIGILISGYLTLHHLGLVGSLRCGGSGSCETVQSSSYAMFLGIPVAAIGLVGYVVIMAVALLGLQPRWAVDRRISVLLLALTIPAVAFTIYLSALEAYVIHAWCRWCLGSAAVVGLIFLCALVDVVVVGRARAATGRQP